MLRDEITIFAETNFRNERRRFGIKTDDRRRHIYIVGKTGTGKTTLLENMIISDIMTGKGVGFIDPHGDSSEKILDFVPKERIKDVIYFNPSDLAHPIAFNPIDKVDLENRHLVASGLMGVFKKIWPDVWSARMEYILNNTILALLESPGSTLLGIMRMLSSKEYRKTILEYVKDPVVKSFWLDEFARYTERFAAEATPAIQNKVGAFLATAVIRNIVGQQASAIDMRRVMDEGKILIMNLSKGRIGEDNSKLLGGLLVTKLQLAAMSRVDIPNENDRRDFYLYVDEFQNFATESFANILSEARKYRLNLTLANQYIAQLSEITATIKKTSVRDAIFGNVGTIVVFRVGAEDAEWLEREFMPEFTASDLVNLSKYTIYLKLMIDGVASKAFSANTLPPYPKPEASWREKIVDFSRQTYGTPRQKVEEAITQWAGLGQVTPESIDKPRRPGYRQRSAASVPATTSVLETPEGQKLYEAICWEGGEKILVPFKPDGQRPVYCKKHIYKLNELERSAMAEAKPVSLKDALSKGVQEFKGPGHQAGKKHHGTRAKKEVNLQELRALLSDIKGGE